jgi:hypothetical protein
MSFRMPTYVELNDLLETIKWPVAIIILGAIFVNPLGMIVREPKSSSSQQPPPTRQVALTISIGNADPDALSSPARLSHEIDEAVAAEKLLINVPEKQRTVALRHDIKRLDSISILLRQLGLRTSSNITSAAIFVAPTTSNVGFVIYARPNTTRLSAALATASEPADLALRLAILLNSSRRK